jgi:hypothetical protein
MHGGGSPTTIGRTPLGRLSPLARPVLAPQWMLFQPGQSGVSVPSSASAAYLTTHAARCRRTGPCWTQKDYRKCSFCTEFFTRTVCSVSARGGYCNMQSCSGAGPAAQRRQPRGAGVRLAGPARAGGAAGARGGARRPLPRHGRLPAPGRRAATGRLRRRGCQGARFTLRLPPSRLQRLSELAGADGALKQGRRPCSGKQGALRAGFGAFGWPAGAWLPQRFSDSAACHCSRPACCLIEWRAL